MARPGGVMAESSRLPGRAHAAPTARRTVGAGRRPRRSPASATWDVDDWGRDPTLVGAAGPARPRCAGARSSAASSRLPASGAGALHRRQRPPLLARPRCSRRSRSTRRDRARRCASSAGPTSPRSGPRPPPRRAARPARRGRRRAARRRARRDRRPAGRSHPRRVGSVDHRADRRRRRATARRCSRRRRRARRSSRAARIEVGSVRPSRRRRRGPLDRARARRPVAAAHPATARRVRRPADRHAARLAAARRDGRQLTCRTSDARRRRPHPLRGHRPRRGARRC